MVNPLAGSPAQHTARAPVPSPPNADLCQSNAPQGFQFDKTALRNELRQPRAIAQEVASSSVSIADTSTARSPQSAKESPLDRAKAAYGRVAALTESPPDATSTASEKREYRKELTAAATEFTKAQIALYKESGIKLPPMISTRSIYQPLQIPPERAESIFNSVGGQLSQVRAARESVESQVTSAKERQAELISDPERALKIAKDASEEILKLRREFGKVPAPSGDQITEYRRGMEAQLAIYGEARTAFRTATGFDLEPRGHPQQSDEQVRAAMKPVFGRAAIVLEKRAGLSSASDPAGARNSPVFPERLVGTEGVVQPKAESSADRLLRMAKEARAAESRTAPEERTTRDRHDVALAQARLAGASHELAPGESAKAFVEATRMRRGPDAMAAGDVLLALGPRGEAGRAEDFLRAPQYREAASHVERRSASQLYADYRSHTDQYYGDVIDISPGVAVQKLRDQFERLSPAERTSYLKAAYSAESNPITREARDKAMKAAGVSVEERRGAVSAHRLWLDEAAREHFGLKVGQGLREVPDPQGSVDLGLTGPMATIWRNSFMETSSVAPERSVLEYMRTRRGAEFGKELSRLELQFDEFARKLEREGSPLLETAQRIRDEFVEMRRAMARGGGLVL